MRSILSVCHLVSWFESLAWLLMTSFRSDSRSSSSADNDNCCRIRADSLRSPLIERFSSYRFVIVREDKNDILFIIFRIEICITVASFASGQDLRAAREESRLRKIRSTSAANSWQEIYLDNDDLSAFIIFTEISLPGPPVTAFTAGLGRFVL